MIESQIYKDEVRGFSVHSRDRGGGGRAGTFIAGIFFSRAPDGAQMQDKWQNTDLDVCLY